MHSFEKILVYCGGDPATALRRAGRLASLTGAAVALCEVTELAPAWSAALAPGKANVPKMIASEAAERLDALAKPLRDKGVRVSTKVLSGKVPAVELTREAVRGDYDLLLKSADVAPGRLSPARLFEQVDLQLVRQCPCSVFLTRKRRTGRHAGLVAAVAPPPEGEASKNIPNVEILETALALAELQRLELHVVRAWRTYGEGALRKSRAPSDDLRDYSRRTRGRFRAALDRFLDPYRQHVNSKRVHLIKGHPGTVIPRFAAERQIDIFVMGAGPREGVSEILIGSTTQSLVNDTECSIVALKPRGFRSPVKLVD